MTRLPPPPPPPPLLRRHLHLLPYLGRQESRWPEKARTLRWQFCDKSFSRANLSSNSSCLKLWICGSWYSCRSGGFTGSPGATQSNIIPAVSDCNFDIKTVFHQEEEGGGIPYLTSWIVSVLFITLVRLILKSQIVLLILSTPHEASTMHVSQATI